MTTFDVILKWVNDRENLLSGLAAIVVLAGVIVSPLGHGVRMVHKRRRAKVHSAPAVPHSHHGQPATGRPSIAVLPFDNMSSDHERDFLADGMTEDIITALSRDRRLFVIARNSSFAYKGKAPNVRDVGRELGVHFVLEGSIRRVGDMVRVTAQLIDARSGAHVWADTVNRPMDDIVKAQDEMGRSIVASITSHFFHDPTLEVARAQPESLEAWELAARAVKEWDSGPELAATNEAERLLRLAVEKEPESAPAWALLAQGLALRWMSDPSTDFAATRDEAFICIERALDLAPNDPNVLGGLGSTHVWSGEPGKAVPILRRAIAALPTEIGFRFNLSSALLHNNTPALALEELEKVSRFDLHDTMRSIQNLQLADVNLSLKNYEKSEEYSRLAIAGNARSTWAFTTLASALCGQGRIGEARDALREVQSQVPNFTAEYYAQVARTLLADKTVAQNKIALIAPAWPSGSSPHASDYVI